MFETTASLTISRDFVEVPKYNICQNHGGTKFYYTYQQFKHALPFLTVS